MTPADLLALGTATLAEAWPPARLPGLPLRPLSHGMALAGPAFTVRCRPGDNLALHRAMAAAQPGEVLVVDYGGSLESGPFGEIMALSCRSRGIAGLVIDGAVRDSAQIAAAGFPVFARGLDIRGTSKTDRGETGCVLDFGRATVAPGDVVVADADAVLILPRGDAEAALAAGRERAAREEEMKRRIAGGETTLSILGLMKEV
ncbi:RraA family protein [Rhodobacter sp. NSM]|uniref:RraA family protein n=1 Tax=Rhodobacter sp. NSM TaxID=3457501 RepID=UPI003FD21CE5